MRRHFSNTETVARCVITQDGTYLVLTTKGNSAVSLVELPEGAKVTIRANGSCARPGEPTPLRNTDMPVEPAVRTLQAIAKIRGKE